MMPPNSFIRDFKSMMKKVFLFFKKDNVKKFIGFVVFLCLGFRLFCDVTYLFRDISYGRRHMTGIKSESDIDMIYIGGSAAFVYWEPLKAWTDCGFTSYLLATSSIPAESLVPYMKEAEKYQNPSLYVIGVRAFQYYSDDEQEEGVRRSSDVMDITSMARYDLLNRYFENRRIAENTDILSYYVDIIKYHTNTNNLASKTTWDLIHNKGASPNKGWEWIDKYYYLDEPDGFQTEERAVLPENATKILDDLLAHCKELDKDVLFVVCPYELTKEDYAKYNTIKDAVVQNGFQFLNANDYYDEMGIDFSRDFYNKSHVNLFGAKKYTTFLENYIRDTYEMPDHRNDAKFAAWDMDAARFFQEEKKHSQTVNDLIQDYEKSVEIIKEMKNAENLSEWNALAIDDRFTLLIAGNGLSRWPDNISDQRVLEKWKLSEESKDFIRVVSNAEIKYKNAEGELSYIYTPSEDTEYTISLESNVIDIIEDKIPIEKNKVTIVVMDNATQNFMAKVTIECDEIGNIRMVQK